MPSAQCKYDDICGRDVEGNPEYGMCILHSSDSAKDAHAFAEAFVTHRERKGDSFTGFVFPERANFGAGTFSGDANFSKVTFRGNADFSEATFIGSADFRGATFSGDANFSKVTFRGNADFSEATFIGSAGFGETAFSGDADFSKATFSGSGGFIVSRFSGDVDFSGAMLSGSLYFQAATFSRNADFSKATFSGYAGFSVHADFSGATVSGSVFSHQTVMFSEGANFSKATFSGHTDFYGTALFSGYVHFTEAVFTGRVSFAGSVIVFSEGGREIDYIFAGTKVDFRNTIIASPDAVTFLEADLTQCRFLDTDVRKVQLVNVKWPQKGRLGRAYVYDEITLFKFESVWSRLERLYRELKQNYEDRRDYERAGDFHYGEKQMRRQNPDTAWGLRFFLILYWLFSGYGERYLRPLFWAGLLFVGSTVGYMWWGLYPPQKGVPTPPALEWTKGWDWLRGAYYSFRVMMLLKPEGWVPVTYAGVINTFQTLLSPLFLGLFALALRQRLKR